MTVRLTELESEQVEDAFSLLDLGLSNWLWRPWYAKIWWGMIPLYWLTMGEPTRPDFLDVFANSGYALLTNMLFIPITPLAVFGFMFFRSAVDLDGLKPMRPPSFRIFGRVPDEQSWISARSRNRFRNTWIRQNLKF